LASVIWWHYTTREFALARRMAGRVICRCCGVGPTADATPWIDLNRI
jgi:hypothetical protein